MLQVPVKHLQHFVALASRPQTQPKELLHLRSRGWCHGTHWSQGSPDQGGGREPGGGAVRRGRRVEQSSGSLKSRVGRRWWYLQILGSPLHTPAVALQGRLALLCGHPMHHGLQLGTPTHPSAPLGAILPGPLGLCPSLPSSQVWYSPSGSYLLAVQPLARLQDIPSVAVEHWPSRLLAGPLGCCCWWRSWPWGLE